MVNSDILIELPCESRGVIRYMEAFREFVASPSLLKVEALADRGWKVLLCESASHFDEEYRSNLLNIATSSGYEYFIAIRAEIPPECDVIYKVPATEEALLSFHHYEGHFAYFLIPEDIAFSILATFNDYLIVAGHPDTLEMFAGGQIDRLKKEYRNSIESEREVLPGRGSLHDTALKTYERLHI